ncbi:hypothetical protein GCM10009836_49500 [Pseudonocardia ailaonensis]|uniref:Uncharacterized protein n=1 Tax=Pseudonocardia ailaonensis TaxID=367279 RepID=A0ABN2NCR4_9PSEU
MPQQGLDPLQEGLPGAVVEVVGALREVYSAGPFERLRQVEQAIVAARADRPDLVTVSVATSSRMLGPRRTDAGRTALPRWESVRAFLVVHGVDPEPFAPRWASAREAWTADQGAAPVPDEAGDAPGAPEAGAERAPAPAVGRPAPPAQVPDGPARPAEDPVRPIDGSPRPDDDGVRPADGPVQPDGDGVRPADGPARPADDPVRPGDGAAPDVEVGAGPGEPPAPDADAPQDPAVPPPAPAPAPPAPGPPEPRRLRRSVLLALLGGAVVLFGLGTVLGTVLGRTDPTASLPDTSAPGLSCADTPATARVAIRAVVAADGGPDLPAAARVDIAVTRAPDPGHTYWLVLSRPAGTLGAAAPVRADPGPAAVPVDLGATGTGPRDLLVAEADTAAAGWLAASTAHAADPAWSGARTTLPPGAVAVSGTCRVTPVR